MSTGTMERILRLMAEKKASDVYLSADASAMIRINGQTVPINSQVLPSDAPRQLLAEIVPASRIEELQATGELNMVVGLAGSGNCRISAFRQRGSYAVVVRFIPAEVPALQTLNVPDILGDLVLEQRGLVLMVGASGAGKSTTLAAMIDHRNTRTTGHILTIEDPIEYMHGNKQSVINQREIGSDTATLEIGLRNALRQAPDVILIGEIRDRETMSAAIAYAQTGHLCLATLHASNSYQALNRVVGFYPEDVRPTVLGDLAAALRAIVSQRLVRAKDGNRLPAVEIMLNTPLIADLIQVGDFGGVREALEKSLAKGSQSFEEELTRLIKSGLVNRSEALTQADSPSNLLWRLQNDYLGNKAPLKPQHALDGDDDDGASFTDFTIDVTH